MHCKVLSLEDEKKDALTETAIRRFPEYVWGVDGNPFKWIVQASGQIKAAMRTDRIFKRTSIVVVRDKD